MRSPGKPRGVKFGDFQLGSARQTSENFALTPSESLPHETLFESSSPDIPSIDQDLMEIATSAEDLADLRQIMSEIDAEVAWSQASAGAFEGIEFEIGALPDQSPAQEVNEPAAHVPVALIRHQKSGNSQTSRMRADAERRLKLQEKLRDFITK